MKLILMRHGQAERFRVPDETRCLTKAGINQAKEAGEWLSQYLTEQGDGVAKIDIALVSPYVRSQQTFQHLNDQVQVSTIQECNDVVPEGNPKVAHDFLQFLLNEHGACRTVLVVSHMPFVSYFLEELHRHNKSMLFDTSSMVILEYDSQAGSAEIEIIYHPQ